MDGRLTRGHVLWQMYRYNHSPIRALAAEGSTENNLPLPHQDKDTTCFNHQQATGRGDISPIYRATLSHVAFHSSSSCKVEFCRVKRNEVGGAESRELLPVNSSDHAARTCFVNRTFSRLCTFRSVTPLPDTSTSSSFDIMKPNKVRPCRRSSPLHHCSNPPPTLNPERTSLPQVAAHALPLLLFGRRYPPRVLRGGA